MSVPGITKLDTRMPILRSRGSFGDQWTKYTISDCLQDISLLIIDPRSSFSNITWCGGLLLCHVLSLRGLGRSWLGGRPSGGRLHARHEVTYCPSVSWFRQCRRRSMLPR